MTSFGQTCCHVAAHFEIETEKDFAAGHDGTLTILLVAGGMVRLPAFGSRLLPPGSLLALLGETPVEVTSPAHILIAELAGTAANEMAERLHTGFLCLPPGALPAAGELFFYLQEKPGGPTQNAAAFTLLCQLAEAPAEEAGLPPLVAEALSRIHSHYGEVYGVEELAEEMGVSKGHLIRSFRQALGMPPGKYLTLARIEAAKTLLLQGDFPLDVIAGLCGFSSANYLCRVFKREVGKSPAAWQKTNRTATPAAETEEWQQSLYL